MQKRRRIGLALGGGAARGMANIGIIKALKEEGVPIEMIAGSSMGVLIGACYAKTGEIAELEEVVLKTKWEQLARLVDLNLALLFKGIIHGQKIEELLSILIGDIEFKDLKIPLAVVASDINSGDEVIINKGSVIQAVRASISIPVVFMPVKIRGRFLMDGGLVNPVPVSVVKDMGATFVIACNTIHKPYKADLLSSLKRQKLPLSFLKSPEKKAVLTILNNKIDELILENKDSFSNLQKLMQNIEVKLYARKQKIDPATPSIFETLFQSVYAMEYEIAKLKVKGADVVIAPDIGHIAAFEFYRGSEAIQEGYKAARLVLKKLQKK